MEMKYFRFLYGASGHCLVHFGELQDTKTGEVFTFLYLREENRQVEGENFVHRPFLFPKHVDLVVLGSAGRGSAADFCELFQDTEAEVLVMSAGCSLAGEISPGTEGILLGAHMRLLLPGEEYEAEHAGWRFLVKSCADGTAAFACGLAADAGEAAFEDCVMGVKALDSQTECRNNCSPDSYGCALGCVLHRDFDVCKYCGEGNLPAFYTGTLLFGGGESSAARTDLLRLARERVGAIRFLGLPAGDHEPVLQDWCSADGDFRRYLIGTDELEDKTIADACRKGWHVRPLILREGEAVCCSGFLKYADEARHPDSGSVKCGCSRSIKES